MGSLPTRDRPRVLVVDDDPLTARALERAIGPDFHVTCASSAPNARAHLTQGAGWSGFLFDLFLQGSPEGIALALEATRLYPRAPVVIASATSDRHDMNRAAAIGVPFLAKPVGPELFADFRTRVVAHSLVDCPSLAAYLAHFCTQHALTPMQRSVLLHAAAVRTRTEFCATHKIAENTYKTDVRALLNHFPERTIDALLLRVLREALLARPS